MRQRSRRQTFLTLVINKYVAQFTAAKNGTSEIRIVSHLVASGADLKP